MIAVRVGVDLVNIERIGRMVTKGGAGLLNAVWTKREQKYCAERVDRLAARWAAKEAVMKALGVGLGRVDPVDIEVVSREGEMPTVSLRRSARALAEELRVSSWSLSLSHEGGFAIAQVAAMLEGPHD